LRHLGGGEQLDHRAGTVPAQPRGYNCPPARDSKAAHQGSKKAYAHKITSMINI
jgi:hypothetical protein